MFSFFLLKFYFTKVFFSMFYNQFTYLFIVFLIFLTPSIPLFFLLFLYLLYLSFLMSILPCIFIQNIIILYETINGTKFYYRKMILRENSKYTCVIIPTQFRKGGGSIDTKPLSYQTLFTLPFTLFFTHSFLTFVHFIRYVQTYALFMRFYKI